MQIPFFFHTHYRSLGKATFKASPKPFLNKVNMRPLGSENSGIGEMIQTNKLPDCSDCNG